MQNIVVKSFFMSKCFWSLKKSLRNFWENRRLCQIISEVSLYHEGCDECKDGIELRERSVDHCVGLNVVTL